MILENFKNGYEVANGSLLAKSEKNDCVVRACANAFNVTYDIAHSFTAETFKRKFRKGTTNVFNTLFPITKEYKLKCIHNPINRDYTHKKVSFTVKTFCSKFNKGTYIVIVHKHALCVKDGIVIDNGDMQFTGYRRVVESYVKVS